MKYVNYCQECGPGIKAVGVLMSRVTAQPTEPFLGISPWKEIGLGPLCNRHIEMFGILEILGGKTIRIDSVPGVGLEREK